MIVNLIDKSTRTWRIAAACAALASLSFSQPSFAAVQDTVNTNSPITGAELESASGSSLQLQQNKGKLIRLSRPAKEVFIANPEIADIQIKSPTLVYVFGVARGETSLYALDEYDRTIFNTEVQVVQSLGILQAALDQMLPGQPIKVASVGGVMLLSGRVQSPDMAETAERLARALGGDGEIVNQMQIMQPTQVNLRVRFAEVSRTVVQELGFIFESFFRPGDFTLGLAQGRDILESVDDVALGPIRELQRTESSANTIFGSLQRNGVDLNTAIDALDQEGFLTILAEPNLTAMTGETASFLAGGEFPVPIPNLNGITIQFREFGIGLEFTPTVLNSGRISMRIRPEVSELSDDGSIRIQDISVPAIITRRAETSVELGSGQSFAIAGLLQNNITQTATKLPGLGDIPILGALFRSDAFRREETELLIVVTPYVVRPVTERRLSLPTDGFIAPDLVDRFFKGKRWIPNQGSGIEKLDSAKASVKTRAGFRLD